MTQPISDLEVLALAALLRLGEDAYGVVIKNDIVERTGRDVSIGSLYKALQRLEDRGLIEAWVGEPTSVRGGRAKKHFRVRPDGRDALEASLRSLHHMVEGLGIEWTAP